MVHWHPSEEHPKDVVVLVELVVLIRPRGPTTRSRSVFFFWANLIVVPALLRVDKDRVSM